MRALADMKDANWVRIDKTRRLRNVGMGELDEQRPGVVFRVYGIDGKIYPRLTLSAWVDHNCGSLVIGAGLKTDSKSWWSTLRGVPYSLRNELTELLQDLKKKRTTVKRTVMKGGEQVSWHLEHTQRNYDDENIMNGHVECDQETCKEMFPFEDGCPAGWVEIETAGIVALRCPACSESLSSPIPPPVH